MKIKYIVGDNIILKTKEWKDYYKDLCGCSFFLPATNPASYTDRIITLDDCIKSFQSNSRKEFSSIEDARLYALSKTRCDDRGFFLVVLSSPAIYEVTFTESKQERSRISKIGFIAQAKFEEGIDRKLNHIDIKSIEMGDNGLLPSPGICVFQS